MARATAPPASPRELRSDALRNQQELIRAATAAVHREGLHVPMGTIASDAGVGIGTLYRHFPTRDDLLSHLTHRSFEQVLANARAAERHGAYRDRMPPPVHRRRHQPTQRTGPATARRTTPTSPATKTVRNEIHQIVRRIIDRGIATRHCARASRRTTSSSSAQCSLNRGPPTPTGTPPAAACSRPTCEASAPPHDRKV